MRHELGDVDVALAEAASRFLPIAVELAVDVPGEDLEEFGPADVVERGMQGPAPVGLLVHDRGTALPVAFGLLGGADRVGERFEGESAAFELDVRQVHGVDQQLPDPVVEHIGGDARVGGDACHQSGLGDTDLPGGERVVPHFHGAAQPGFLQSTVCLCPGQLQVVLHPRLGGEEPLVAERLGGVEMIGDGDACSGGLAAQLFDPGRPRRDGGGVEARRVEPLEQRQALSAVLDHRMPSTRRPVARRRRWRCR